MARRVLTTNLNSTQAWNKVKEIIKNHHQLVSLRDKIRWNESQREITLSHMGVDAKIKIKGELQSQIEIVVETSFPASFIYDDDELATSVEKELRRYL